MDQYAKAGHMAAKIVKDFSKVELRSDVKSKWTSFGTARYKFINQFADDNLKKQLTQSDLPESFLLLRKQFAEIQIGSEYFFQTINFLSHIK